MKKYMHLVDVGSKTINDYISHFTALFKDHSFGLRRISCIFLKHLIRGHNKRTATREKRSLDGYILLIGNSIQKYLHIQS